MLICATCGQVHPENALLWRCPCGGLLDLDTNFPFAPNPAGQGLLRYATSLPLERPAEALILGAGQTPLVQRPWDQRAIHFKLDYLCPSGSYKDRGMAVLVNRLRELGVSRVIEDSSGNAGASMAAYAAATGLACDIYVPASTSEGKCTQIAAHGAQLKRIPGSREDTTRAAEAAATHTYYASHNWSPYFAHGVKTYAFEIYEQLGKAPDLLILPAGQGSLVLGALRGFEELRLAGRIARLPRILAVQAERYAPLARAFVENAPPRLFVKNDDTMAEGIAAADPVRGPQTLAAVAATQGAWMTVSEEDIWRGFEQLCAVGLYAEPTSAVTAAALTRLLRLAAHADEKTQTGDSTGHAESTAADPRLRELARLASAPEASIVVYLSGSGLKATDKIGHLREIFADSAASPSTSSSTQAPDA